MSDPVSGGVGKAAQQMMQEMQKQMAEQVQEQQQVAGADKANFNDAMVNKTQGVNDVTNTQKVQETTSASDVLRTAQSNAVNGSQSIGQGPNAAKKVDATGKTESGLKKMLNQMVDGQNKLDDIIKMATSGKTYSQQDLLAIQASVYKFSQELDLTSKVVEKATSGIKQTMQTQV